MSSVTDQCSSSEYYAEIIQMVKPYNRGHAIVALVRIHVYLAATICLHLSTSLPFLPSYISNIYIAFQLTLLLCWDERCSLSLSFIISI